MIFLPLDGPTGMNDEFSASSRFGGTTDVKKIVFYQ